jgi:hypothetical protein
MRYIWVDDIRTPTIPEATWCRTYASAIEAIEKANDTLILCLDHDLGEEKTGYDICKYLVENSIPVSLIQIHSANPVGRANMNQLLTHYGYNVVLV